MQRFGWVALALVFSMLATVPAAHAQKRVALVIGNSAYLHTPKLANPKNDATDMAAALKGHGFQVVEGFDLDKVGFDRKVRDFAMALRGAEAGVLFYAGHGLQVSGRNYLVPIDAKAGSEELLDLEMVRVDVVQRAMEVTSRTNLLFLDACRDNPLARNLARSMGTRSSSVGTGLASIESGIGTLISFSTHPGAVASDGAGRNSPYASALVKYIASMTDDLGAVLISVRNDVMRETERRQVPWEHSALTGRFYFNPTAERPDPAALHAAVYDEYVRRWNADSSPSHGESDPARIARLKRLLALAQQRKGADFVRDHQLIGLWEGEVKGAKFSDGSKRTLIIATVRSDGTVYGGWSATVDGAFGLGAPIRIEGERVFVTTQSKSHVVLRRLGDGRLQGAFTLKSGETYQITLFKK